jgi:altronate dehydratase
VSPEPPPVTNRQAAIVISGADNVATALESIDAGRTIAAGVTTVTAVEPIPRGHKIALRPIRAGAIVVKYGNAIGTASSDIAAGAHVHTHNVSSARGRGDLSAPPSGAARIAEPPDDGEARAR